MKIAVHGGKGIVTNDKILKTERKRGYERVILAVAAAEEEEEMEKKK